jgi:hypothetical protein
MPEQILNNLTAFSFLLGITLAVHGMLAILFDRPILGGLLCYLALIQFIFAAGYHIWIS